MLLTIGDLEPFADIPEDKALAMISDAVAMATVVAPCVVAEDFAYAGAARAILRAAVLRWIDQGSGAQPALVAGPFGVTPQTQPRRNLFWPSEIAALQRLCGSGRGGAFAVDTWAEGGLLSR
ncbi:hypothetical protein [Mycolicibacterium mageritense]|uniref:Uncharacterized protein n=1 Tax=Mycolicibacterium mageritense TaxID=53462 RepID=A0AAI8U214_MYCME|nr:hypothetical protein [Mycolicibacterium mageritense]BDY32993.1 hypothetical protein hbim_06965 [Mycolicibacterium mageritense]